MGYRSGIGALLVLIGGLWVAQGTNILKGSAMTGHGSWAAAGLVSALVGAALIVWGLIKLLASVESPPRHDPRIPLWAGLGASPFVFALVLISVIPGHFKHRYARRTNSERFWLARRAQLQVGVLRCPQQYRVVLTPEGFTETTTYRETGVAVEISEHKVTRGWWAAAMRPSQTFNQALAAA